MQFPGTDNGRKKVFLSGSTTPKTFWTKFFLLLLLDIFSYNGKQRISFFPKGILIEQFCYRKGFSGMMIL